MTQPVNTYSTWTYERKGDVVAVKGRYHDDWAAYEPNAASRRRGHATETIVMFGDKLPYDQAREMFPEWDARYEWRA